MKIFTYWRRGVFCHPLKHSFIFLRFSLTYLFMMSLSLHLVLASKGSGQGLDEIRVTVNFEEAKLSEVFQILQEQTGLLFAYPSSEINSYGGISMTEATISVSDVLDHVLSGTPFEYRQVKGSVIISAGDKEGSEGSSSLIRGIGYPIQEKVTGRVTDENGQPLPGVNVLILGSAMGTVTDIEGNYRIAATREDVLVFSFIGFSTIQVPVDGRSTVSIQLQEDVSQLDAVEINAGYYTVKDEVKTGNISRITRKEIEKQPVSNPLQAMQGRMAGVYITQKTGVAGGGFDIQIRGRNSLREDGNNPLYIIDGVPFTSVSLNSPFTSGVIQNGNPLSTMNVGDVESIEVLKDADATAIYGSRGANGVVLITTKKGRSSKETVSFNFYRGFGKMTQRMELLSTPQYLEMRREAYRNDEVELSGRSARDLLEWDTTRYTDWQKTLIGGTADITNAQASIGGGGEQTHFLLGTGYYRESSVFQGDGANQKGSIHFNLNHLSTDGKLDLNFSVMYVSEHNHIQNRDLTEEAMTLPPNAPRLYTDEGALNWENSTWTNPLAYLARKYRSAANNLISNATIGYMFAPGLRLFARLGYNHFAVAEKSTNPIGSIDPAYLSFATGSVIFADNQVRTWIAEPQIHWSRQLGQGDLQVLAGLTFQENVQENQALAATGYTNDGLLDNIRAATDVTVMNTGFAQYRYSAVFGRINYSWKKKYLINLTGRRDGSSRFGPGNQFANFGAIGAAWIFSNEGFFDNSKLLSFGKLRVSYGLTGSDQIGDYQYLNSYSPTTYPYNGTPGLILTRLPNDDYSWETNEKAEAGIELGFFENRLSMTSSYFHNSSSNQLVGYPLPAVTGQTSIQYNLPAKVVNTGWEFEFRSTNVRRSSFVWETSANLTVPRNKLVNYPNLEGSAYVHTYQEGASLNIQRKLAVTGVDPVTGMYTFEDLNGDGEVTIAEDGQFIKEVGQQFYGGLFNRFSYKGFQLEAFVQFVDQTGWNYLGLTQLPGSMSNQATLVLDRWQREGDITEIQAFSQSTRTPIGTAYRNSHSYGDNGISDASFVRLKNVSISYQFPERWVSVLKIQNATLYAQAQNLFTLTNYQGLDPETQSIDSLPPLRVLTFGIKCSI